MKGMFKEIIKETTSFSNEIPSSVINEEQNRGDISDDEEKSDEEMEISSSDEDSDLYIEQVTTLDRISLISHKKKYRSKEKRFQLAEAKEPND